MEQRVISLFHESIEAKMHTGELLAPLICDASDMISQTLLAENKIIALGNGISAACAQSFCASLMGRFEQDRPSLPAMALGVDSVSTTGIAEDFNGTEVYARQIRALGQPGDILLLIAGHGSTSNLIQAVRAAHDREMIVIALTGNQAEDIGALLDGDDLELPVQVEPNCRVHEVHLLTLFCICDLIDQQIFGGF